MIDFKDFSYELDLDFSESNYIPKLDMKQYDVKSRFIKAKIYDKGQEINITDKDLSFKIIFKKPDQTVVFKDCEVKDGVNPYVLIPVNANTLAVEGIIISELVILQKDEIYSSKFFYINCLSSLHADKGQIESSDEYEGLLEGLIKAEKLLKEFERLDSIVALHHIINVQADNKTISFAKWNDYTNNNDIEVFLSGVKLIQGVDFNLDKTAKTITMINNKTFKNGDKVFLCMYRRMISNNNETTLPANKIEVTPNILGQTNVQDVLIEIDKSLNNIPNPNDFINKNGDTMTGNLNMGNNKVIGNLQGNSDTTTKLESPIDIEIGQMSVHFDGSQSISFPLNQMGAAPSQHRHNATDIIQNANNRFVTDTDKDNWNRKETTIGSQEKANKALEDSKKYTDGKVTEVNIYTDTKFNESKTYTDTKVSDLVNSAPATLDTLKELADALGNDPNFVTTLTNLIGTKADKVHNHTGMYLPIDGNAVSASKLQTSRNIGLTGDATGSAAFNGSSNIKIPLTLSNVPRNNTNSTQSPNFGKTFTAIDNITTDAKGRLTGVNTKTITLPIPAQNNIKVNVQKIRTKAKLTQNQNSVSIGTTLQANDIVDVFLAGVRLEEGLHYTLNRGNNIIAPLGNVKFLNGDYFNFEILRATVTQ